MIWLEDQKTLKVKHILLGKINHFILMCLKMIFKKIIDDYVNRKIEEKDILDKLNKVNKGVEIYEKNKDLYNNSPNIENQIINSNKYAEGLKKLLD